MDLLFSCVSITQRTHTSTISLNLSLIFVGFAPSKISIKPLCQKNPTHKKKKFRVLHSIDYYNPIIIYYYDHHCTAGLVQQQKEREKERTPMFGPHHLRSRSLTHSSRQTPPPCPHTFCCTSSACF
ncbi:hypothetical protein V6Z12_A10G051000 [Gossypium hirsutum]